MARDSRLAPNNVYVVPPAMDGDGDFDLMMINGIDRGWRVRPKSVMSMPRELGSRSAMKYILALAVNLAAVPVAAVTLGACIVEKHFTLAHDYSDFRDHQLSGSSGQISVGSRGIPLATLSGHSVKRIRLNASPS